MNASIFGLGYVGAVTAGCLTEQGHKVIGADVSEEKVNSFNTGESPIVEPELGELLARANQSGLLSGTIDANTAVRESDVSVVCVGTPSLESGRLNLEYVRTVSEQISYAIKAARKRHTVIFRSTMLPGSTREMVEGFFKSLIADGSVELFYCPEFLREGTAVEDFRKPSLVVVGTINGEAPENSALVELLGKDPQFLKWEGAELIKYACNYFHAVKVSFANEIGRVGKHAGVDSREVMDVICRDTRLNISPYYMKPGNPFGGSCLPKDVNALTGLVRQEGIPLPMLESVIASNEAHLDLLLKLIRKSEFRKVSILGLAFKNLTDDLRGSPMVAVAETLLGQGYELSIYDPNLNLSRLTGSNERQISRRMPHLAKLLKDQPEEAISSSGLVIAAQRCVDLEILKACLTVDHHVLDVNGWPELEQLDCSYEGLCWD